ncbi:unnamed protein product [Moneuplotes crassus]|uniref:Nudix hydrolase domain-containing protein n=1 Tax=Euplotes crassus TaxID=5936 RepID=A0AAD1XFE4_EUPCR|nr:unnamed protein product [Moneuplotes crassus]
MEHYSTIEHGTEGSREVEEMYYEGLSKKTLDKEDRFGINAIVENVSKPYSSYSSPAIITYGTNFKERKLQNDCLCYKKEEGKGSCIDIEDETYAEVYFYFKYKKVIDMMYPRIHICSEDQREFLVEELGKRKNKYEVFKLIFIHEKNCLACKFRKSFAGLPIVLTPKKREKICLSTCCFIVDKNKNICICRRIPKPEKLAGWGVPGKGAVSNKEMRADMVENLKKDIGLTITMSVRKGSETKFFYEGDRVIFEPKYLHQCVKDRHNYESLSISSHELILYYYMQIPEAHENINLVMSNIETDCIAWISAENLKSILSKKNKSKLFSCSMIKHKKNTRKKIEFSTLFPYYPNEYSGEGIVKEDAYAFLYLVDHLDDIFEESE